MYNTGKDWSSPAFKPTYTGMITNRSNPPPPHPQRKKMFPQRRELIACKSSISRGERFLYNSGTIHNK